MKESLKTFIPKKSIGPIILAVMVQFVSYYIPKFLNIPIAYPDLLTPLDEAIPFVPFFIVFYTGAFIQWVINYIVLARGDEKVLYRIVGAYIVSKLAGSFFFVFFPTTIERPVPDESTFFGWITSFIYLVDTPKNLFPSFHVLEGWGSVRAAFMEKEVSRLYKIFTLLFNLVMFASILLVKQHYVLDIFGGILFFEAGLLITRLTKLDERLKTAFEKLYIRNKKTVAH